MNFQQFCDARTDSDQQRISINNTFVISFGKPDGSTFNIDPDDVVAFLHFLSNNHAACRSAIESDPKFTANTYTVYQEKPYRALYKLAEGDRRLETIRSMGGSQTRELTKVISKLVCFLSMKDYKSIKDNTFFDKQTVDTALKQMPSDLKQLNSLIVSSNLSFMREQFILWMKASSLSESSAHKYAFDVMRCADNLLYGPEQGDSVYAKTSVDGVIAVREILEANEEWTDKNSRGGNMYSAGLNKYLKFIESGVLTDTVVTAAALTRLTKPFLLLAGISGTGKTRFVREQARETDRSGDNYCLVPVRPDWHEPSDLLGYISRLSGHAEYVTTDVLTFIVKAWRTAAPAAGKEGMGEVNQECIPYWLCLDEMNLAPVEQYFADYLSVLESREFSDSGYRCEALLNSDTLKRLIKTDPKLPANLGLDADDGLWHYFLHHGISLPPNLIVAGTVNMDETTHGFSRKVIDRALTLDFGGFFPNKFSDIHDPKSEPVSFTWSPISHSSKDLLVGSFDEGGAKSIAFLESVNEVLKRTPFELAYRALNELLLQVICLKPADDPELQALWDDFLMTKILPRIDGDEDKLRSVGGDAEVNILDQLEETLASKLTLIWGDKRKDYFRKSTDSGEYMMIECRSKAKLEWMRDRLEVNTFTSYWP